MAKDDVPFEEGAAVQHKTGGPKMIFIGVDELGYAICSWMVGGKKTSETFVFAELEPYPEPERRKSRPEYF